MKKFALKSVATVVGAGLSGVAAAAVTPVDLNSKDSTAFTYASEAKVGADGVTLSNDGAAGVLTAKVKIGAGFNKDSTAYLRFDLPSTVKFKAEPSLTCDEPANKGSISIASGRLGVGESSVIFTLINPNPDKISEGPPAQYKQAIVSADTCTIDAESIAVPSKSTVTLRARTFETLTAAVNEKDNLADTGEKDFVKWAQAISFSTGAGTAATANVTSKTSGGLPYGKFVASEPTTDVLATLGNIGATVKSGVLRLDGVAAQFSDIVKSVKVTVSGDFSFVTGDAATTIGTVSGTVDKTTKSAVYTFAGADRDVISGDTPADLKVGAGGTKQIPTSKYEAAYALTAQDDYELSPVSNGQVGEIKRNGNLLLIPYVQSAAGHVSRFTLVNRGSTDAYYSTTIIQDQDRTADASVTDAALSGTIKAGEMKVISLSRATSSNLSGRGALLVTVEAAKGTVSGTYQVVNTGNTSMNNQTMVEVD